MTRLCKAEVSNSKGLAGHMRLKVRSCRPHENNFFYFVLKINLFGKIRKITRGFLSNIHFFWCSRAALDPLADRMWPAGRVFETPDLKDAKPNLRHILRRNKEQLLHRIASVNVYINIQCNQQLLIIAILNDELINTNINCLLIYEANKWFAMTKKQNSIFLDEMLTLKSNNI